MCTTSGLFTKYKIKPKVTHLQGLIRRLYVHNIKQNISLHLNHKKSIEFEICMLIHCDLYVPVRILYTPSNTITIKHK